VGEIKINKAKDTKELQDKLYFSKFIMKTILNSLFVAHKYIPMIIRIFLKAVSELYQKHISINSSFYNNAKDGKSADPNARENHRIKNKLQRILIDIIATKWLVNYIFINPDKSGLITSRPISKLSDLFLKFSKIFIHSLRGPSLSKSSSEEQFMELFSGFIEEQHKHGRKFMKSVMNISIGDIIPKGIFTEKQEEFILSIQERKYSENPLIDIF